MKNATIPIQKRRTIRKLREALHMIERGNRKILDTFEIIGPTLTTQEVNEAYKTTCKIMYAQVDMFQSLISEKEENDGCR